ncbi:hypothetical protein LguiB_026658 [Lonicera macranthoides]
MGTMINQMLINAVRYEPFVLSTCKSTLMRTASKLQPDTLKGHEIHELAIKHELRLNDEITDTAYLLYRNSCRSSDDHYRSLDQIARAPTKGRQNSRDWWRSAR